jgi:hypothetical protein
MVIENLCMNKRIFFILAFSAGLILYSCSRKSHPSKTVTATNDSVAIKKSMDSLHAVKAAAKRRAARVPIPKMIEVNDSVAHKSVDGRLYYDVMGHRYWRNYKDGKYYLFDKSMYNNDAFKPG